MSSLIAAPELFTAAATDVANIGSTLNAAHLAAAPPTLAVVPAAADEVSASIAHLFSQHAQGYQALGGKAVAFQEQFAQHLTASASSYVSAEAANVSLLQPLTAIAGSVALPASLNDLLLNFLYIDFGLQLGALTVLGQLADSDSFLTPLVQLAAVGLFLELILTFALLFNIVLPILGGPLLGPLTGVKWPPYA